MTKRTFIYLLSTVMLAATACTTHVRPYKPKVRNYRPDQYDKTADQRLDGSLWSDSTDTLFTHRRSARIGDVITVVIHESANAQQGAGTDTSRKSDMNMGISAFGTAVKQLQAAYPNLDMSKLLAAGYQNDFSGQGQTSSSGSLNATLTARIKNVMPNGDFYIEGNKVVMVNEEESHLYFSGVVRPSDIQADNTIASNLIADAQVEYTGRGPVADKQRPGWFSRFVDWITPF